jgi:hypothetical protein
MHRDRSHQPIAGARRPGPANTERFVTLAAPLLVAAAAFGCLTAAQFARLDSGSRGTFATALDEVMAAVAPRA